MGYFTVVELITAMTLGAISILVSENDRIKDDVKERFYDTYLVILLASAAEWLSVVLNGAPSWTVSIHKLTKLLDYVLTPAAALMFVRQVMHNTQTEKYMKILIYCNAALQFVSLLTGWTFYIDENNYYQHGPIHILYTLSYVASLIGAAIGFLQYGKQFRRRNQASLAAIIALIVLCILIQEAFNTELRIVCLAMAEGSVLMFIHYNEFYMIRQDDLSALQKQMLETDPLTGLYSRYSYNKALDDLEQKSPLPNDFVILSADVNGLKKTNDNTGHAAGDELISGAAWCLASALSQYGNCYRTGGDEFIAILKLDPEKIPEILEELKKVTGIWQGELVPKLSLSLGVASTAEFPDLSVNQLINKADERMYREKRAYYSLAYNDRRNR